MNALDQGDLVPRTSVVASRRAHEHFVTTSLGSQTYSRITASGSSRIHNGNNYYITYDCSTGHGPLPTLPSDQQTAVEYVSRSSQKRKRPVSDAPEILCDNRERQTLASVLESLGQYSTSIQQQRKGEQSTRIAAQLAIILEHFEQAALEPFEKAASNPRSTADLDRQLQDLRHQLRRATSIKINAVSPRAQASRQYKAQSKLTRIAWGRWEISLRTKTLHSRSFDGEMLTETCSVLDVQHTIGSRGPCIAAYFGESIDLDRTTTMHPIVLAYNQVGNDAKVLELLKNDDLDGLMRHLALGQASIRDCDEEGRALLHYACHWASYEICKFLVNSGCDVDRLEVPFTGPDFMETPLSSFRFVDREAEEGLLEQSLICRKLLLQAGADPTLGTGNVFNETESNSMVNMALGDLTGARRITEPFEQVLREGSAFFDVRSFQIQGKSIWLHACSQARMLNSPKILQILVHAGANTAEICRYGWNCLFACILNSLEPSSSAEFEALQYLLTICDDIFARDDTGCSIFDHVDQDPRFDMSIGSYKQDLWYCAIYRSGLAQIFEIPPPTWTPIFTSRYTIQHYRALLYLDTWNTDREVHRVPDYVLVDKDTLSEQDREAAPGLREWNISDLLLMEQRLSRAYTQQV